MTEDMKRFSLIDIATEEQEATTPKRKGGESQSTKRMQKITELIDNLTNATFEEIENASLEVRRVDVPQVLARLKAFEGYLLGRPGTPLTSTRFSVSITGDPRRYAIPNGSSGYIKCIKEIRALTRLGLREAKTIVDACEQTGKSLIRSGLSEQEAINWSTRLSKNVGAFTLVEAE